MTTRNIQTTTDKTARLVEWDKKHYIHPTTSAKAQATDGSPLIFSSGNGVYATSTDGERYLDGLAMLWNVNLGHGNKELAQAAYDQMMNMAYSSSFKGYSNEPAIELSKKLAEIAPGDLNSVFYTSGGSESNDTAFKLSRFYWELKGKPSKRKIIALNNAYHGVTVAAQTATGIPAFHNFAGSNIGEVYHAKAHLTNCELGDKSDPNYEGSIRGIIEKEGADTIAAVILEPVQGSGGVHIPPEGYIQAVRKLCDEFGILMIADEVICGFGRTGKMFAVDHWDVVPDLMSMAKGISSGYSQLGGVMLRDEIRNTLVQYDGVLSHGFTYSGHPTACAVALKNIEILERDHIIEHVQAMEKVLKDGFRYLEDKHKHVTNTRSLGLLAAIELYEDPETNTLFDDAVQPATVVVDECFDRKLILRTLGSHREIIAIAPPLIINKQEIEEMIGIIDDSITAFVKKLG
ncbi:aspartate aminotransferase family protein [Virgibacillus sp. SK37]|uniref:aminotransferase family protein n=1 Tax=Virgibacillus sp. SK37 TaxID=403957 RepID=UPI0011A6CCEA|nr:aspartate aminotransferase family protein [Virgibacillus sp. SK37]